MKIYLQKRNKAFTLVETLVAISIFTMSILGLISILASGISNTGYAKQKMAATYLAQEGIEYARNVRDTNVLSGAGGWATFITPTPPSAGRVIPYEITDPDFSGFSREILILPVDGTTDEVKISSKVTWRQGSGIYNVTFSENLFNWVE
ncbi:MAG: type II secretion system protein [Candidatus Paceibacterota bacterium]